MALGPGTRKSYGYRVAHHGYLSTSCPGQYIFDLRKKRIKIIPIFFKVV